MESNERSNCQDKKKKRNYTFPESIIIDKIDINDNKTFSSDRVLNKEHFDGKTMQKMYTKS